MLNFLGIIIEMGLVQMPEIDYYWSKSKLFGSEIIQNISEQPRRACRPRQIVQGEITFRFIESQIQVNLHS
jgi:hypothetical protein